MNRILSLIIFILYLIVIKHKLNYYLRAFLNQKILVFSI